MKLQNTLFFLLYFSYINSYANIQIDFYYNFNPIKSAKYIKNTLWVAYELGCNAIKEGFVFNINSNGELSLGLLTKQNDIKCASIPKIIFEPIKFLNLKKIKSIKIINSLPSTALKFVVFTAKDIRIVKKDQQNILAFINDVKCISNQLGILINDSENQLKIGYVEYKAEKRFINNKIKCNTTYNTTYIDILNSEYIFNKLNYSVKSNTEYKKQPVVNRLNQNEFLIQKFKIIPLHSLKLNKSKPNFINAEIKYLCNQFPIGLFLNKNTNNVYIGAMILELNKYSCSSKTKFIKTLQFDNIKFHDSYTVHKIHKTIPVNAKINFALPTKLYFHADNTLSLGYLNSCNTNSGIILTKDINNKTTLGILQTQHNSIICNKNIKENKLPLNYIIIPNRITPIYALRFFNPNY